MAITDIVSGDIFDKKYKNNDIIIGMNPEFKNLSDLAIQALNITEGNKINANDCDLDFLGTVVTFESEDTKRRVHMILCHTPEDWNDADKYIKQGMNSIFYTQDEMGNLSGGNHAKRSYSIVKIGTGPEGIKNGADFSKIVEGMASSDLPVTMFVLPENQKALSITGEMSDMAPVRFLREEKSFPIIK